MTKNPEKSKNRTVEEIREHYELEKGLASKLRNASREERRSLYGSVYEAMYKGVPQHSMLTRKESSEEKEVIVSDQMKILKFFLGKDISFLEVGPGDCALSFEVAKFTQLMYLMKLLKAEQVRQTSRSLFLTASAFPYQKIV